MHVTCLLRDLARQHRPETCIRVNMSGLLLQAAGQYLAQAAVGVLVTL